MKKWPRGELRRIEKAYSPKWKCYGHFILGSFIKNVPDTLRILLAENTEDVLIVEFVGNGIYKVREKHSYESLPMQYRDSRGQYNFDANGNMLYRYEFVSWSDDAGMVTGFPLRPWITVKHPCTISEYNDTKHVIKYEQWAQRKCESPVELQFAKGAIARGIELTPQWKIYAGEAVYRTDFAIVNRKLAIEIDGHEYHKTKEQRTNDTRRQRALELAGWRVIRFTGSEIHANLKGCLEELSKYMMLCTSKKQESLFDF
jgi:very-short-patch-repair endonuclease